MDQKIIVVDDEPSIVIPLEFLMQQNGYDVLVAQSGEEAVELIGKNIPNLVLLDIMLPGIDGFEVCEIIRLNPRWKKIKVIFLTARKSELDMAKGLKLGADDYITKPFSNATLVEKVKGLLSGSTNKKETQEATTITQSI
jgi:two-component system alkaline phosphatase synthesis response regulator PhoP